MAIKVTCKVDSYDEPAKPSILVQSHWNDDQMVVLVVGSEERSVKVKDLIAAINNATNTARY